jgi:NADH-quinone oxidoreductase subunit M
VLLLLRDPPWVPGSGVTGDIGGWLVALSVVIRKGIFPFHSWYPLLFANGPMSSALMATMPQVASYTAIRLLVGHADGVASELVVLSQLALITTAYGAALAMVQRSLRGLIGMLAMSQSAMVLAGLAGTLPMGLNGALCMWVSSGLSLTGIGLVTWSMVSRHGPISIATPQGLFRDAPELAGWFLMFGLAGLGFPGTLSFVADDLIVSGSLDDQLHGGLLVIAAHVFSGIALIRAWFHVFGGPDRMPGRGHPVLPRERMTMTPLVCLLLLLGLYPAPLVAALERTAASLLGQAARSAPTVLHEQHESP